MHRAPSRRWAMVFAALLTLASVFAVSWADPPGDFNGDGVEDESGPLEGGEEEVAVYSGSNGSVLQIFGSPHPNGLFGFATAIIADVSGDGNPDLAATAPLIQLGDARGLAYLLAGNNAQVVRVLVGPLGETFGVAAAQVEDWNGDGTPDLRIASRFADEHGDLFDRDHIFSTRNGSKLYEQPRDDATLVAIAEDLDHDGDVDADDVLIVNSALGQTGDPYLLEPDLTGNGVVDTDDVAMVVTRLGEVSATAKWAPIPGSASLGAIADLKSSWLTARSTRAWKQAPGGGTGHGGGTVGGSGEGTEPGGGGGPGGGDPGSGDPPNCEDCEVTVSGPKGYECLPLDGDCLQLTYSIAQTGCLGPNGAYAWGVAGARIISPTTTGSSITVEVCDPGSVVVYGSYSTDYCGGAGVAVLNVLQIDIDVDSDNNDQFAIPERTQAEEDAEDVGGDDLKPGKVCLANTFDLDYDALPDYADGFDLMPQLAEDDYGPETQFTPIVVDIKGIDWSKARIRLEYEDSPPLDVTATLNDPNVLPDGGRIRVWRSNLPNRDGHAVTPTPPDQQGGGVGLAPPPSGDFVAPGDYAPDDILHDELEDGGYLLYVEAVRFSEETGDTTIRVDIDPDGPQGAKGWMCADQIRLTCTQIEIWGKPVNGVTYQPYGGLLINEYAELTTDPEDVLLGEALINNSNVYAMQVFDPRDLSGKSFYIEEQPLPLGPASGGSWVTPDFVCVGPDSPLLPTGMGQPPVIVLTSPRAALRYNPDGEAAKAALKAERADKVIDRATQKVIAEMESSGWTPAADGYSPTDSGAFGKAVHRRVAQRLPRAHWLHDAWIHKDTKQIVHIGLEQPAGFPSTALQQVDAMFLQSGYTPQVGQVLDQSKVIRLYELKFTLSATPISAAQKTRLTAICGDAKKFKLVESVRHWNQSWMDNARALKRLKMLGAVGPAAIATFALIITAQDDETWERLRQKYEQVENESSWLDRKLTAVEYINELTAFLGAADPTGTAGDLLKIGLIYHHLGAD